jgi:hypothetical protein
VRRRPLDLVHQSLREIEQLGIRRVKHGAAALRLEVIARARQIANVDSVERPAVRTARALEIGARFGEGEVQTTLARSDLLSGELKGERRLARAGITLNQVACRAYEATA